jgi:hypothetical protein
MHAIDRPETPFHRVKIATFNVNNVNPRLSNLLDWLRAETPDVVCLQELKADNAAFPRDTLLDAGYHAVWRGERTWNGVAILARGAEPVVTRDRLPGDVADKQSREEARSGGQRGPCDDDRRPRATDRHRSRSAGTVAAGSAMACRRVISLPKIF